jgi:hypothetical protein
MIGKNVTYYLGAGASAGALPVVGERFNKRFGIFCQLLRTKTGQHFGNYENQVIQFLDMVYGEFGYYYSPDTYARKLFFNSYQKYHAFKILLSSYFVFEQFCNKNLAAAGATSSDEAIREFHPNRATQDPRYDVIFAALLNTRTKKLPDNLHVVSWNYDVQFEKSYSAFSMEPITRSFEHLGVYPCPDGVLVKTNHSIARMVKINGTAGMVYNQEKESVNFPDKLQDFDLSNFFSQAIEHIRAAVDSTYLVVESMLQFAWEQEKAVMEARGRAKELIAQTDILVVIGYSFPLYNRLIDREILQFTRPDARIIIQMPNDGNFDQVHHQMKMALPIKYIREIVPYLNTGQFYVPPELL